MLYRRIINIEIVELEKEFVVLVPQPNALEAISSAAPCGQTMIVLIWTKGCPSRSTAHVLQVLSLPNALG